MAIPPLGQSNQISAASFHNFTGSIKQFLESKNYKGLDAYFHENESLYRPVLEEQKTLDCLLELLLEKPLNDDDCFRAFRLAAIMENKNYSPSWSKICQAMCYFQFANEAEGNRLVQQMIDSDLTCQDESKSFRCLINDYKRIYASTGNHVMWERMNHLFNCYHEALTSQTPEISSIPFGETKI